MKLGCTRAFYRDYEGRPTLDVTQAETCDIIGHLRHKHGLVGHVEHVIRIARRIEDREHNFVSAFMTIVRYVDSGGDQGVFEL